MSVRVSGEQNFAVWLRQHDVSSVQVVDERSVVRLLSVQFTQANLPHGYGCQEIIFIYRTPIHPLR